MTPAMEVTKYGRPMTPVNARAGGCAFEVPLDADVDRATTPVPSRLAKLPKLKRSKAERKQRIMEKLQRAEARREVRLSCPVFF